MCIRDRFIDRGDDIGVEPAGVPFVGPLFRNEGIKTAFPVGRLPGGKGTRGIKDFPAVREFQGFCSDAWDH